MPDEILTQAEVAQMLKVADKTLYTTAQRGEVPPAASPEILSWPFCPIFCGRARSLPPTAAVKITHCLFSLGTDPLKSIQGAFAVVE